MFSLSIKLFLIALEKVLEAIDGMEGRLEKKGFVVTEGFFRNVILEKISGFIVEDKMEY